MDVLAAGRYLTWGVVSISATNALVIVLMLVTFVLALVVPFPAPRDEPGPGRSGPEERSS